MIELNTQPRNLFYPDPLSIGNGYGVIHFDISINTNIYIMVKTHTKLILRN